MSPTRVALLWMTTVNNNCVELEFMHEAKCAVFAWERFTVHKLIFVHVVS